MAISKEKLREMRENSAAGAAKQHAKEQAELDRYMKRRDTEVANMLSTNEKIALVAKARDEGQTISQITENSGIPRGSVSRYIAEAIKRGLISAKSEDKPEEEKPSGMIDAAELTTEQREELTAQAEADAGIIPERTENAADKPQDKPDICDVAKNIMDAMRKVMDIPGFDVMLNVNDYGTIEVTVVDKSEKDNNITLSRRL